MQNNITKLALLFGIIATISFGANSAQAAEISGGLGHIELVLADSDGNIKQYVQTDNTITEEGLDCLVDSVFGTSGTGTCANNDPFDVIAIGEGTNGDQPNATGLTTELLTGCFAVAVTPTADTGDLTQRITITAVFGGGTAGSGDVDNAACIGNITEAGLFSIGAPTVTTPTNIFAYQDFTVISIGTADTLTVTWDIDFT